MNKKAVYIVGNYLVPQDAMPFKIKPFLQKAFPRVRFIPFDPTENFPKESDPIFIDTVINVSHPRLFTSVEEFQAHNNRNLTVHSFDFYTELALHKKAGLYKTYTIIGVPPEGDILEVAQNVASLLASFY